MIEVVNRQRRLPVDTRTWSTFATKALAAISDNEASATNAFVSDKKIRELNRQFRGIDKATDVLSFPQDEPVGEAFPLVGPAPRPLGDIVISGDRVRAQAADYGHSQRRELAYLAVHGLLHLLGFDHETEPDRERMRRAEESALAEIPRG